MKKDKQINVRFYQKELDLMDNNIKLRGHKNRTVYLTSLIQKDNPFNDKFVDISEVEKINNKISDLYNIVYNTNDIAEMLFQESYVSKKMHALIHAYLKTIFKNDNIEMRDDAVEDTLKFMENKIEEFKEVYKHKRL